MGHGFSQMHADEKKDMLCLSAFICAQFAKVTTGKGVSFMEDGNNWHYRIPKEVEVITTKRELGLIP